MAKRVTVFMDFDGTVASTDVGYNMVKKFAGPGWEEINTLWEKGVLTTGECAQRTLDLFVVQPAELLDYFLIQEIDPGLIDFIRWMEDRDYEYWIVSDGYDNYIEPILQKYNLSVRYYSNHLEYDGGWAIISPHINTECAKCGTCKSLVIESHSDHHSLRVYIGDGHSDKCAAVKCDIIFAKSALADYCQREGIAFYHFRDFFDVQKILEQLIEERKHEYER